MVMISEKKEDKRKKPDTNKNVGLIVVISICVIIFLAILSTIIFSIMASKIRL